VYTGFAVNSLTQVASDDDACTSPNANGSQVTFNAVSGTTYRISIRGFAGSEGTFTLNLNLLDVTAPRVTSTTPANNAPSVARGTNVTATFSEAMKKNTINPTTFTLVRKNSDGTTTPVAATLTYKAGVMKAILDPDANLNAGSTYIAKITTGAKDLAGNRLDQDPATAGNQAKSWKFTTVQ
jgi:hypothetical protein